MALHRLSYILEASSTVEVPAGNPCVFRSSALGRFFYRRRRSAAKPGNSRCVPSLDRPIECVVGSDPEALPGRSPNGVLRSSEAIRGRDLCSIFEKNCEGATRSIGAVSEVRALRRSLPEVRRKRTRVRFLAENSIGVALRGQVIFVASDEEGVGRSALMRRPIRDPKEPCHDAIPISRRPCPRLP